jgi:hypothetical protein
VPTQGILKMRRYIITRCPECFTVSKYIKDDPAKELVLKISPFAPVVLLNYLEVQENFWNSVHCTYLHTYSCYIGD